MIVLTLRACPSFQSTPSVGRATLFPPSIFAPQCISIHALRGEGDSAPRIPRPLKQHFNPRPPWGGRPAAVEIMVALIHISIHALRGEGDFVRVYKGARLRLFQSTPSVGRATLITGTTLTEPSISIHALRGEGDGGLDTLTSAFSYFNPRPPWGGRPVGAAKKKSLFGNFNPRPPWGGRLLLCHF